MNSQLRNPWTKQWLESLIGQEESGKLEFKSSRAIEAGRLSDIDRFFNDSLSKALSAFINTEGGLIVVGVEEDRADARYAGRAMSLSKGIPRSVMDGHRFENKLMSRVHPATGSFAKVHSIKIGEDHHGDLLAFVIDVKPGHTAYQADDKRYYCRRGFSSEPMDDKDVRLRMLTDDRPRVAIQLIDPIFVIRGMGTDYTLESLQREVRSYLVAAQQFNERHLNSTDEQKVASIFNGELRILEPWKHLKDKRVYGNARIAISNVGNITVRSGALSTLLQPGEHSLGADAFSKNLASGSIVPFDFLEPARHCGDQATMPLYPSMSREIGSFGVEFPRQSDLNVFSDRIKIVVYLDSGTPAELDVSISEIFANAYLDFEKDIAQFASSVLLKDPI